MEIDIIRRIISEMKFKIEREIPNTKLDVENYITIVELLEKQIPKKPKKEFNGMESLALCECGADIYNFPSNFKGCPYCLQVIDWSGV